MAFLLPEALALASCFFADFNAFLLLAISFLAFLVSFFANFFSFFATLLLFEALLPFLLFEALLPLRRPLRPLPVLRILANFFNLLSSRVVLRTYFTMRS